MSKKYRNLEVYFKNLNIQEVVLTFADIEKINKSSLPDSARKHRAYWGNHFNNSIAKSWMMPGYKINNVDILKEEITFVKHKNNNETKKNSVENRSESQDLIKYKMNDESNQIIDEIRNIILKTSVTIGTPLDDSDFHILYQPKNHIPQKLPNKKIAVYSFVYNGMFLKIGQVGTNSNVRYQHQHYNPGSSNSNLAKSLLNDPLLKDFLREDTISDWIKENCERYDIIIDSHFGKNTLNYIEGMLHKKYNPRYEG